MDDGIGRIARARGARLYAGDGRRFLDMEREGGRLLGGAESFSRLTLKAMLDRGLSSVHPGPWEGRLLSELGRLFPGMEATLFPSERDAREAFPGCPEWRAFSVPAPGPRDPFALPAADSGLQATGPLILILPIPAWLGPGVVLRKVDGEVPAAMPSSPIPGMRLAAARTALDELRSLAKRWNEAEWAASDTYTARLFSRDGPYLRPRCAAAEYPALREAALGAGIILSADHGVPSVVPLEFSAGELAPILKL